MQKRDPDIAYEISSYDLIYIIFKPTANFHDKYPDITKFDGKRQRHYVKGMAVKHVVHNAAGQAAHTYPKQRTVISSQKKWLCVAYIDGNGKLKSGWVFKKYFKIDGNL